MTLNDPASSWPCSAKASTTAREAHENHSCVDQPLPVDEFAEVFVLRNEQRLPFVRSLQNNGIVHARFHLGSVKNIVPSVS